MDVHVPYLDTTSLRAISCIRVKRHFTNLDLSVLPGYFSTELIHLTINDIQSNENTPEYQSLGNLTRRNLKRITIFHEWEQGKRKQLNHIHNLGMFGKPMCEHKD